MELLHGPSNPSGVAVSVSHIYWVDELSGTIMSANLDGTGVTTLVTGQNSGPAGMAVGLQRITSGHIGRTIPARAARESG